MRKRWKDKSGLDPGFRTFKAPRNLWFNAQRDILQGDVFIHITIHVFKRAFQYNKYIGYIHPKTGFEWVKSPWL